MLPKLQQSSIAQSLRRDNLASQIQCNSHLIQAKTNSRTSSASKPMTPTNHGKTTTLQRILILHLETSLKSISLRRNSKIALTSLTMNSHYRDLWANTHDITATEEKPPALSKRNNSIKSQFLNQEPSRNEIFLHHSSEGTTIEVIFLSESIIKTPFPNLYGRFQLNHSTIITIFPFSLMELVRNSILTVLLQFSALMICCKKEETRFCL